MRLSVILTVIVTLLTACAAAQSGMETIATNFAADLVGNADTRPYVWGTENSYVWPMRFTPDPSVENGVIQIEELHGDLVSWPTNKGLEPAFIPMGRFVGVLVALHREDRWDSDQYCEFCNRDCLLYMQDAITYQKPVSRIPVDIVDMGYKLGEDHTLYVKVAHWLNDAGVMVHMEPTFTIKYRTVNGHPTRSRANRSVQGSGP